MHSFTKKEAVQNLPERVDAALEAIWRGSSAGFEKLLENTNGGGPPVGALYRELIAARNEPPLQLDDGSEIGGFRILRELGRGGMGVVYAAEQKRPRRMVALKVVKTGSASTNLLRRFEHEVELLGRLQHPGIARIYEAGTEQTAGGPQSYFVMELVDGPRLTDHADAYRLDTRGRLELLCRVCDAVQHAHQKGVIHRDLKPANILVVAEHPDDSAASPLVKGTPARVGQPKILDFGVARTTELAMQKVTLHTHAGQLVGTIPYMSPEQVSGDTREVDTRSDVYALGVIMFQVLASRLPYDLNDCSIAEAARRIRDEPPVRLGSIDKGYRGDIETIVGKALEKDRSRRYQSASNMANDIRRFLCGEPIDAKRNSTLYVLRKQVGRHRGLVATACVALLSLITFAVYAGMQAGINRRLAQGEREARQLAEDARQQATLAEREALAQREAAIFQAQRARYITAFLVDMLGLANPDITQTPDTTMQTMLDRASEDVDQAFRDQPEAEATVRTVLGQAYASLGELELAEQHLKRALHLRQHVVESTPEDMYAVLWTYWQVLVDLSGPGPNWRGVQAIAFGRRVLGKTHPEIADALADLPLRVTDAFDRRRVDGALQRIALVTSSALAVEDPLWLLVADQLYYIGFTLEHWGFPEPACRCLRKTLNIRRRFLPETHTAIVRALGELIDSYVAGGQYVEAEQLALESLEILEKVLPQDHWYFSVCRARLGASLTGQGRFDQAEEILLDCHPRIVEALGGTNGYTAAVLTNLCALYGAWDQPQTAERYRVQLAASLADGAAPSSLDAARPAFGPEHTELVGALERLALELQEHSDEIGPAVDKLFEVRRQLVLDNDVRAAMIADLLRIWARHYENAGGDAEHSYRLYTEAIGLFHASQHGHPEKLATVLVHRALFYQRRGQFERGEIDARECLTLRQRGLGERDAQTGSAKSVLGGCLMGQDRYAEAEPLIVDGFQTLLATRGLADWVTRGALDRLTKLYGRWRRPKDACPYIIPALQQAIDRNGSTEELEAVSWQVAKLPGLHRDQYLLALEGAERGVALTPDHPRLLNTLGVAQYRLGRLEQGLGTLQKSNDLAGGMNCVALAFLAMVHQRLGDHDNARLALQALRDVMQASGNANTQESRAFLREAERLIGVD